MRTDFTTSFATEKDKKAHGPVTLMKIDWPAIGGLPALTLRLADRGSDADNGKLTINGTDWYAVILNAGDLDRLVSAGNFSANSVADLKVTLTNLPTALFSPAKPFSYVFKDRPPEAATITVSQWFEGLLESDIAPLFVARMEDPVRFDELTCSFDLVDIAGSRGSVAVGSLINLTDYPDAPESSIGKMKPIVIGQVEDAPSILVKEAAETIITSVVAPGDATLTVADTAAFAASGTLKLNDDEVAYTGKTATTFTGCTGVNEFHFADDVVLEKITDHRYLFSDPAYAIKQISGVQVDGQPADAGDYSIDLPNGEVVFNKKPEKADSLDTKFLQAQLDAIGTGNNAVDPLSAIDADTRTTYAKINQTNNILSLKQTTVMPAIGVIGKVKLLVHHFLEEKLPNDSLSVDIVGIGQVGVLSPPALDDVASSGNLTTDFTHSTLDNIGVALDDISHQHDVAFTQDQIVHNPTGGLGFVDVGVLSSGQQIFFKDITYVNQTGDSANYTFTVSANQPASFSGDGNVQIYIDSTNELIFSKTQFETGGSQIFVNNTAASVSGSPGASLRLRIVFNAPSSNFGSSDYNLAGFTRTTFSTNSGNTDAQLAGKAATKTGGVSTAGSVIPIDGTAEKSTLSVTDFIDITSQVAGDWAWFTNKEVQVKYNGTSDGRTAFIIHVAFEIEYARRRLSFTDKVTALVQGVKDDGTGTVTGTANALIERPDHVFKWSILNLLSLTATDINTASFTQAGTDFLGAITGGYKFAGIIQGKTEIKNLWRSWEKNCRAYFFWDLGKAKIQFRPLNQITLPFTADKTIPSNMIRLDGNGRAMMSCERTPNRNIVNTIDLRYKRDWASGEYSSVETGSDADSITRYGRREKLDDFEFDWSRVQVQAADLTAFFLAQHKEPSDVLELELFLDNVELERGDLLKISPPTHENANLPALVLGAGRKIGSGRGSRMDSIPLTIMLLTVFLWKANLTGTATLTATLTSNRLLAAQLSGSSSLSATLSVFTDSGEGGFGVQPFGTSKFGGVVLS